MFSVGVHMLSLAGEHLLVQTWFCFFVSSDVVCIGSFQHRPEVRETLRFASSSVVRVYTLYTQIKKKHITELLFIWLNLFQANPFTFFPHMGKFEKPIRSCN